MNLPVRRSVDAVTSASGQIGVLNPVRVGPLKKAALGLSSSASAVASTTLVFPEPVGLRKRKFAIGGVPRERGLYGEFDIPVRSARRLHPANDLAPETALEIGCFFARPIWIERNGSDHVFPPRRFTLPGDRRLHAVSDAASVSFLR